MSKEVINGEVLALDHSGRPCKTKANFPKTMTLATIATAWATGEPLFEGVTQCSVTGLNVTAPIATTGSASTASGDAFTAMDKVEWEWEDIDGNKFTFETGGPLPGQVLANGIDIDRTVTAVANFITWVIATYNSPEGKAVALLVKAFRTWRTRKAKNI